MSDPKPEHICMTDAEPPCPACDADLADLDAELDERASTGDTTEEARAAGILVKPEDYLDRLIAARRDAPDATSCTCSDRPTASGFLHFEACPARQPVQRSADDQPAETCADLAERIEHIAFELEVDGRHDLGGELRDIARRMRVVK